MKKNNKKEQRVSEEKLNNQGCLMKIVEYKNASNIIVEFQDKYKAKVHTGYNGFKNGSVRNPYVPSVYEVGMTGNKYPIKTKGKQSKEYAIWCSMLKRCFDLKYKIKHSTYKGVICCKEWLLYENFYEWLHGQDNFNKWLNGFNWNLDKDILIKGNKIYSPETCCLVPVNVNNLFTKSNKIRGDLPIGVTKDKYGFQAKCNNPITNKRIAKWCSTLEEAFQVYKTAKENVIKQVAQDEYDKGNITRPCYEAMMNYEVEITD